MEPYYNGHYGDSVLNSDSSALHGPEIRKIGDSALISTACSFTGGQSLSNERIVTDSPGSSFLILELHEINIFARAVLRHLQKVRDVLEP